VRGSRIVGEQAICTYDHQQEGFYFEIVCTAGISGDPDGSPYQEVKKMKIEVLGSGCPKCKKVEDLVKKTVAKLQVEAEVTHVYDFQEIARRGVMMTPAVLVDGVKKVEGRIPTEQQIASWLS
jgi:small redox-active disulfide protein 2